MNIKKIITLAFLPVVIFLSTPACSKDNYVTFGGYAQGGTYSVKANLKGVSANKKEIADSIENILSGIDFSISGYNKNSLLSRYNKGEEISQDRYFREIKALSDKYKTLTDGAFDVGAGELFDLWGFGFTTDSLPSAEKVKAAMDRAQEGKTLNFNAIAQGYSCDVIASFLHSIGVKDMLVDIGEIYCSGLNPRNEGWIMGVDNPTDGNDTPGKDLKGKWQSDGKGYGIVTSGNYRKFYIKDGRKYSHTIDPRTGYPVTHNLLSATITAPTAAEADALATACMVMGAEKSKELINSLPEVEGYLITTDEVWTSEGFNLIQK